MACSNSLVRRVLPFLAALTAIIAGGLACGPAGGGLTGSGVSGDPNTLILEDAEFLFVFDAPAFLESRELPSVMVWTDTRDAQERLLAMWEGPALVHLDEVSVMTGVLVRTERGSFSPYHLFRGEFDPDDLQEAAEEEGFEEDAYRGFSIWEQESGNGVKSVFAGDDFFVIASGDLIRDFLKALDREEGFASGQHDLRRVLDAAGEGIGIWAYGDCEGRFVDVLPKFSFANAVAFHDRTLDRLSGWAAETSGCEAAALTVTGGDEDTTLVTMAVLFRSERRAENGLEDLEDRMEDSDELDIDVEEARVSGDLAVIELVVHE